MSVQIKDSQWEKIYNFLKNEQRVYAQDEAKMRLFIEAILWMARSGAPWRLLPEKYGHWNTVFRRFSRWSDRGIWQAMFEHFSTDTDMSEVMIDATIVRAHHSAAGALKKKGGQAEQALGRSRGGFSTKIHALTDAFGNPIRFILTGGQRHDVSQAEALLVDESYAVVLADKGYDSDALVEYIEQRDGQAEIPSRNNRLEPRAYDEHLYKERHLVECNFGFMKHYRRFFSRFDKYADRYLSFVHFVATFIWLR